MMERRRVKNEGEREEGEMNDKVIGEGRKGKEYRIGR